MTWDSLLIAFALAVFGGAVLRHVWHDITTNIGDDYGRNQKS